VPRQLLENITESMTELPQDFTPHPKIERLLAQRAEMGKGNRPIDWGMGELLAYGSLLYQKVNVRLTGQDCARGTFSHRHAIITDIKTGREHMLLGGLHPDQGVCRIYDSPLSEAGVLGFEHGYSLAAPSTLVIWEAQFGDFANGAQVIIDQFIATSESKWQRMSGMVLLLPHGYEGQGPEHSSARLERFLQLSGRNNMVVVNLTTPAQIFHALRRQMKWDFRKPMIVMSPKSLLRLPAAVSTLEDLSDGHFQEVIDDASALRGAGSATVDGVKRVILSTGKVHYDLATRRAELGRDDIALVRLEQVYPFPAAKLASILAQYPNAEIVWVQEEPRNMGAWTFVHGMWSGALSDFASQIGGRAIRYVGREIGASPAVGSTKLHEIQLKTFLEAAFA
jgi:2-oxoglutarate dehydrogenase E1 component